MQNDIYPDSAPNFDEIRETKFNIKYCYPEPSDKVLIEAEYLPYVNDSMSKHYLVTFKTEVFLSSS